MFGLTVKIGPPLGGVPANKDELMVEMKAALFVTEAPLVAWKPLAAPSSKTVTMSQLDTNSTMGRVVLPDGTHQAYKTRAKQATSVECLRVLNTAIMAARR